MHLSRPTARSTENRTYIHLPHHAVPVSVPSCARLLAQASLALCNAQPDIRRIPIAIRNDESSTTASTTGLYNLLPSRVLAPLLDLALLHGMEIGASRVHGRVALVYGTPCPKLHVDKVFLRGLCTLQGPGCVIAPDYPLDGSGDVRILDEDGIGLVHIKTGDAVLMFGADSDADLIDRAMLHRSPIRKMDFREPRLIIQTDCWT